MKNSEKMTRETADEEIFGRETSDRETSDRETSDRECASCEGREYSAVEGVRKKPSQINDSYSFVVPTPKKVTTEPQAICTRYDHLAVLHSDGTVDAYGKNNDLQCEVSPWRDIVDIAIGRNYTVGLHRDGSVVATGGNEYGQIDVASWRDVDVVESSAWHTVGLRRDGTVVATGFDKDRQCQVGEWRNIVAVAVSDYVKEYKLFEDIDRQGMTVGLHRDGTVVAAGSNRCAVEAVAGWRNIVAVAASGEQVWGLTKDGTVICTEELKGSWRQTLTWRNIVDIRTSNDHIAGLCKDGTVVAAGWNEFGACDVSSWHDVEKICTGRSCTIGLKKDGLLICGGGWKTQDPYTREWIVGAANLQELIDRYQSIHREEQKKWRENRLCQHCGQKFEGILFKKCSRCGRKKDYRTE